MNHDPEQLKRIRQIVADWADPFKSFMNSDVSSADECERLLFTVREIQADTTQIRERNGNAYWVDMTADGVTIRSQWMEEEEWPTLEYSLEEFETLVLQYLERIKK